MIVKGTFAMWLLNVCLITREISKEMVDCELSLFHLRIRNPFRSNSRLLNSCNFAAQVFLLTDF